ncbi:hypothetical protein JG663_18625, partial [Vibrio cholerae]|uniref:hypothetical protein n=1 Tax=Vibrio cholerae TaxID=666 RepID=UPI0018F07A80
SLSKEKENIKYFSKLALDAIIIGEEIFKGFFPSKCISNFKINEATQKYADYLNKISENDSLEIIVSAILAGVLVYEKIG